jgi:hypothetical protein
VPHRKERELQVRRELGVGVEAHELGRAQADARELRDGGGQRGGEEEHLPRVGGLAHDVANLRTQY